MRQIFLRFPGLASLFLNPVLAAQGTSSLPLPLDSYQDPVGASLWTVLVHRVSVEPFNLVALAIFVCAIVHTFFTTRIRHWAHDVESRHAEKMAATAVERQMDPGPDDTPAEVSFSGQILHFLGEIEAVFGIWVLVLAGAITWFKGWPSVVSYISDQVSYTEPLFVVVIMALAATHPVLSLAEKCLRTLAGLGRESPGAWWLSILLAAPLLGSLITEPAAMTIAALLLARQFYDLNPSSRLKYATLGLLFVNISIGGTLTHFAAPPVIMVARAWNWDFLHMLTTFGYRSALAILLSTLLYYFFFRRELAELGVRSATLSRKPPRPSAPFWITTVQVCFLAFTVWQAHHPVLFIGAFLFFLAFSQATAHHQSPVDLRPPILVGFFLAGLVIHGGLQAWWIQPILSRLDEVPLFLGATVLTAFNDNAAITYLASLVPGFTDPLKYAVVAGAVAGGGLTVIANAPNPAGQAILGRYFSEGVAPQKLLVAALPPTVISSLCYLFL